MYCFQGMKKLVYLMMALVVMAAGCQTNSGVKTEKKGDGFKITSEDSSAFVEILEDYLKYGKGYADSAAKTAGSIPLGGKPADPQVEAYYHQNKEHVDSLLRDCILLVKQKEYQRVLHRLDAERVNIYMHPGNTIDNELNMGWMVETLFEQQYKAQEDSFYARVLPWYEFSVLHMEMLQTLGKDVHPEYESTLMVLSLAYQHTNNKEKQLATLRKIMEMEKDNPDTTVYNMARKACGDLEE